jgi:hypothetical protein
VPGRRGIATDARAVIFGFWKVKRGGELQEEIYSQHRDKLFFEHFDISIITFSPMLYTHSFIYQPRHIILTNDGILKQHT